MKFSSFAGTAIVPLLARLVLFAAFLPAGAAKIFSNHVYEGEAAGVLTDLGIGQQSTPATALGEPIVRPASFQTTDTPEQPKELLDEQPAPEQPDLSEQTPQRPVGTVEAKTLHHVTVLLVKCGWKPDWKPQYMAWGAALTELLGGLLILAGLFSRIWGLALAVTMGFAYALTSWPAPIDPNLFALMDDIGAFNRLYCQLGLLVLGLGVFLTGPGPLSLDRLFFQSGRGANADRDDEDDD